jgi:hypothetical protein
MDVIRMLKDLRAERDQVDEAVLALTRLASGQGGKRRGRPPKWMSQAKDAPPMPARKRRPFSAATRKRMSDSQKERWAAKKTA